MTPIKASDGGDTRWATRADGREQYASTKDLETLLRAIKVASHERSDVERQTIREFGAYHAERVSTHPNYEEIHVHTTERNLLVYRRAR